MTSKRKTFTDKHIHSNYAWKYKFTANYKGECTTNRMQLLQMVDLMRWIKRTCQVNNLCIEAESIHIHTLICFLFFFPAFVANTVDFLFLLCKWMFGALPHTQTHIHTAVRCTVQSGVVTMFYIVKWWYARCRAFSQQSHVTWNYDS